MSIYEKRGYLNSEFKIFHLTDAPEQEFQFHYHDFDKIIIFIKGNVTYLVEGKSYPLKPYDIVFVNHNEIHKPDIDTSVPYERIIVYISPNFIHAYQTNAFDLTYCLKKAKKEQSSVLRIHALHKSILLRTARDLEHSFSDTAYANELYRQVLFIEFMIHLNRAAKENDLDYMETAACNQKIVDVIRYINENLSADLSIEHLASASYISRYHLMRMFKAETGYTIGNYITYKRLAYAKELMTQGIPLTQVCFDCGFKDYSTFSRAYKKFFQTCPRNKLP